MTTDRENVTTTCKFRDTIYYWWYHHWWNLRYNKRRHYLLELAVYDRYCNYYLWLLTQCYSTIPKNLRMQVRPYFFDTLKGGNDTRWKQMITDDKLVIIRGIIKESKHACLYVRNEHPHRFKALNKVWDDNF